jgi:hypothetical protein
MSNESVFDILETLEATQGTKLKTELLMKHAANARLMKVFQLTNDPYVNFYVAKVPKAKLFLGDRANTDSKLDDLLEALARCMSRDVTGNDARDLLMQCLEGMTQVEHKWAARIIQKKLRLGLGDSSCDKVWPGLISSFEVSLAETIDWVIENEKLKPTTAISYPARIEPKWDGFRCIAVKSGGKVTMYARSGRVFERAKKIDTWLEKHMQDGWVLDGELMAKEWNDTASIIGSRKNHKDDDSLQFHVFDCMPLDAWKSHKGTKSYAERLADIPTVLGGTSETVVPAQGKTVTNEEELLAYFDECVAKGYEGIMVKRLDTPYVFKRSDAVMKLKPIVSWDCVLTDVLPAKDGTKWEGMHTIIAVQVPGGGITRVGTGFSDEEREFLNAERGKLVGRPCEVQGQPPLTEDGKIRFPRFMRWREEWDVSPDVKALISKIKDNC